MAPCWKACARLQPLAGAVRPGTHEFHRERAECATSLLGHWRIKLARAAPAQAGARGFARYLVGRVPSNRPDTKRQSHYSFARLAQHFDPGIHFGETSAVEPLDVGQVWSDREVPKAFSSGT